MVASGNSAPWIALIALVVSIGSLILALITHLRRPAQEKRIQEDVERGLVQRQAVREIVQLSAAPMQSLGDLLDQHSRDPGRTSASAWWGNIGPPLADLRNKWLADLDFRLHSRDIREAVLEFLTQSKLAEDAYTDDPTTPQFWAEAQALLESEMELRETARGFFR